MIKGDSIKKSYLSTLLINIISKPLGLVSSALIAYYFGTGQEIDAFLWVAYFVMLFYGVTIGNWGSAIVPVITEIKNRDGIEKEKEFISFIYTWAMIIVFIATVLLYFSADYFVNRFANFDEARTNLAIKILQIMSLYYFFTSLYNISEVILNSYREFKTPYFLKVIFSPLIIIASVYFFAQDYGINSLIAGNIISFFLILISVIYFFIKRRVFSSGIILLFDKNYLNSFFKILLPLYLTQILNNAVEIFSKYLLTGFQVGAVAFISYSERLINMINSAFADNLSKIYFTEYGHVLHEKGKSELAKMYEKNLYLVWMIVIPISSLLFFFGDYILAILFKRGSFTEESLVNTFLALKMLSIGIFAWSGHLFTGKLFATLQDTIIGMYLVIPNSIITIAVYYYLAKQMGFEGVALSASLSAVYSFTLLLIIFFYRHYKLPILKIFTVLFVILLFWFGFSYELVQYFKYDLSYNIYESLKYFSIVIAIYVVVFGTIFKIAKNKKWIEI
jgi:putative peptidoglycan lipid II flippase